VVVSYGPNEWGVTFETSDEQIADDLKRWDWSNQTDPISVATLVLRVIREQTMADLGDDGETIAMGLFEHEMPLTIGLSRLLDTWIGDRTNRDGKIDGKDAEAAAQLADRLEATVRKLRECIAPAVIEEPLL
jgi:hypothetical protein